MVAAVGEDLREADVPALLVFEDNVLGATAEHEPGDVDAIEGLEADGVAAQYSGMQLLINGPFGARTASSGASG